MDGGSKRGPAHATPHRRLRRGGGDRPRLQRTAVGAVPGRDPRHCGGRLPARAHPLITTGHAGLAYPRPDGDGAERGMRSVRKKGAADCLGPECTERPGKGGRSRGPTERRTRVAPGGTVPDWAEVKPFSRHGAQRRQPFVPSCGQRRRVRLQAGRLPEGAAPLGDQFPARSMRRMVTMPS